MQTARFEVKGMSCGHCVGSVDKALRGVPGVEVKKVAVGSAEVAFDPAKASKDAIVAAVEEAGYQAREAAPAAAATKSGGCSCGAG